MKFADIKGQEDIKEHLQNAIALGKTSHAYIMIGARMPAEIVIPASSARATTTRISAMFRMKSQIPFRWRTSDSRSITTLSSSLMRANTRSILWMRRKR